MFGRVGILLEQRLGRDDKARRADATLQRRVFQELLLQRVQPFWPRHAFNGGDLGIFSFNG